MPFLKPILTFAALAIVFSIAIGAFFYAPMTIVSSTINPTIASR